VSGELASVLKGIAEYAAGKGLKPSLDEENLVLVIEHGEYPLRIVIEPRGEAYVVELLAGDEIDEAVEDLLEDEVDPRAELEDVIETMLTVVDYAVKKLGSAGVRVDKKTRDAILDVYDAIESFVEEEE